MKKQICQQNPKPKKEFQVWTICLISLHLTKQNYRPNQSFCVLIQWVAVVVAPFNAVRTWQLSVSIVLIVGITNSFLDSALIFFLFLFLFYCCIYWCIFVPSFAVAVLEIINVIFIVLGITLVVAGAVFMYETMGIPGPGTMAATFALVLGVVVFFLGIFGYQAAKQRKILGKEFKGKCKLTIYAIILGVILGSLLALGVALMVWLGGTVPDSGHDDVNKVANDQVAKAEDPVHNFVGCVYDVCCIEKVENKTTFPVVLCKMTDGVPDADGNIEFDSDTDIENMDMTKFEGTQSSCEKLESVLSNETCAKGSYAFRQAVGKWFNDRIQPLAMFLMVVFGLFLVAWIFAILEIFWCCGLSDIEEEDIEDDDDPTKIYPEDDYDY